MVWRCPAPVKQSIKAKTISFSSSEQAAAAGNGFSVRLTCGVIRSFEFTQRRPGRYCCQQRQRNDDVEHTFTVDDPAELRTVESCRATLRRMMMELPQLRPLELTENEWDAVVPGDDVVSQIVAVATSDNTGADVGAGATDAVTSSGGHSFDLKMRVCRRIVHGDEVLFAACKERAAAPPEGAGTDESCAICLEGWDGECALELPGCGHAFHRECISVWFSKAATCPICRHDSRLFVMLKFLAMS